MNKKGLIVTASLCLACAVVIVCITVSPFWGMFMNWLFLLIVSMCQSLQDMKLRKELEDLYQKHTLTLRLLDSILQNQQNDDNNNMN